MNKTRRRKARARRRKARLWSFDFETRWSFAEKTLVLGVDPGRPDVLVIARRHFDDRLYIIQSDA